jgi:methyl-accepting chemotaxis protein
MLQRIEATMEGISQAIETGMSRKLQGEQAVEEQKAVLQEKEKRMDEIKEKLMRIRENLSNKIPFEGYLPCRK